MAKMLRTPTVIRTSTPPENPDLWAKRVLNHATNYP
jgi:hypothetical protein